jgi:dihydrolipoamide dehydrogenase
MTDHDVVFIGGGPAGYTGAIRAAQLGFRTACVELEPKLGGTCLRVGCIPSKALLEASEKYDSTRHHLAEFGVRVGEVGLDLPQMMKRKDTIVDGLTGGVDFLFKKNKVTRYLGHARIVAAGGPTGVRVAITDGSGNTTEITAEHVIIATGSNVAPLRGVEVDGDRVGTSTERCPSPRCRSRWW